MLVISATVAYRSAAPGSPSLRALFPARTASKSVATAVGVARSSFIAASNASQNGPPTLPRVKPRSPAEARKESMRSMPFSASAKDPRVCSSAGENSIWLR